MAGLVPAIHVFARNVKKDVDARHKAGHDENPSTSLRAERSNPSCREKKEWIASLRSQ
jgi:hypothetical protein